MDSDFDWFLNKAAVVLASWKLIIAGTLVLIAIGAALLWLTFPIKYTSRAVLPVPTSVKAILTTELILDPVLRELVPPNELVDMESARQSLARNLTVSSELNRGSGLYTMSFTADSPTAARSVLTKIVENALAASRPSGSARADSLQQIETLMKAKEELEGFAAALIDKTNRVKEGSEGELYARALTVLISDIAEKKTKLWQMKQFLEGTSRDDVLLWPTLPNRRDPAGTLKKLLILAMGSVVLMICWVLFRQSLLQWRERKRAAGSQENVSGLRAA